MATDPGAANLSCKIRETSAFDWFETKSMRMSIKCEECLDWFETKSMLAVCM